jgi:hypothetical protein
MNRNVIVKDLRNAKRNASLLAGPNKIDNETYSQLVKDIDRCLKTLGESTLSSIGVNAVSRVDQSSARFSNTPPSLYVGATIKASLEKKSVAPVEPEPVDLDETITETVDTVAEGETPSDETEEESADEIEGAAEVGGIIETDISQEFLAEIAESDNKSLVARFQSAETLQALITQLGGKEYTGKSTTQLASILKRAAKAEIKTA